MGSAVDWPGAFPRPRRFYTRRRGGCGSRRPGDSTRAAACARRDAAAGCAPAGRQIYGQLGRRIRRLVSLGYSAEWIAATLALKPRAVADFLRRLEPVRKAELARPREPSEERRLRAHQAAAAARDERRRLLTPPAGWSNGDRFATGEARDWAQFMTALQEARASGADILGLASRVWFAPPRSRPEPPPVEPAIWVGPENPHAGNPKLTPEMLAEMHVLRAQGWSTGKLAKRYGVKRATICYALLGRTFHEVKLPPCPAFADNPLARPDPQPAAPVPVAARSEPPATEPATSPGWSGGDRFATGECREWNQFLATMAEARASGADVRALQSPVFFAAPLVEPAIWTGPTDDDPEEMFEPVNVTKVLRAVTARRSSVGPAPLPFPGGAPTPQSP